MRARALLACAVVGGCGPTVDSPTLIKDLRVLSVKAQPPELLYEIDILNNPAPPQTVIFSALVVDPSGETLTYRWSYCPVESDNACNDYAVLRAQAPVVSQADLDAQHSQQVSGTTVPLEAGGTSEEALWPYDNLGGFNATVSSGGVKYFLNTNNPLDLAIGGWPEAVLDLRGPTGSLQAFKRAVLNLRDPGSILAQTYGFTVCAAGQTPQTDPGCLPLKQRTANTNPSFGVCVGPTGNTPCSIHPDSTTCNSDTGNGCGWNAGKCTYTGCSSHVTMKGCLADHNCAWDGEPAIYRSPTEPALTADRHGAYSLAPGESVQIVPTLDAGAYESYQTLRGSLQSGQIQVVDETESPSIAWYCSQGSFDYDTSSADTTGDLSNFYTAPDTVPTATNGLVTLFLVARDQRGGEAWTAIDIHVARRNP